MIFQRFILPDERSLRSLSAASALMLCGLFVSGSSVAQEQGEDDELELNSIELFVGATLDNNADDEASYGITYERRINEDFGIGILAEYTNGREWIVAMPYSWHFAESWKATVAVGAELTPDEENEANFLTRIGISYEFEFAGWSLAPEVNVDFVDDETKTVVGLSVGFEF